MSLIAPTLIIICSSISFAAHVAVLRATGQNLISGPITLLNQTQFGNIQSFDLIIFAAAQAILAWMLGHRLSSI